MPTHRPQHPTGRLRTEELIANIEPPNISKAHTRLMGLEDMPPQTGPPLTTTAVRHGSPTGGVWKAFTGLFTRVPTRVSTLGPDQP